MAVDNRVVAQLIHQALARQFQQHPGERLVDLVGYALDDLKGRRNDPAHPQASLDENLAAAEHYMVARWSVGVSAYSRSQMAAMVMGYEYAKMLITRLPARQPWGNGRLLELLLRSNPSRPTAPPSHGLIAWGLAGASAGESDRLAVSGPSTPWVAMPPAFVPLLGAQ